MNTEDHVKKILDEVLYLDGRSAAMDQNTPLLGSLPELDSLAIVEVVAAIEKEFRFSFEDDEINADVMASLGSLTSFIDQKIGNSQ